MASDPITATAAPYGLTVTTTVGDVDVVVAVPQPVEARGGEAIAAYVADFVGSLDPSALTGAPAATPTTGDADTGAPADPTTDPETTPPDGDED